MCEKVPMLGYEDSDWAQIVDAHVKLHRIERLPIEHVCLLSAGSIVIATPAANCARA